MIDQALLEHALRFERRWDARMCGPTTRAFRELLGYAGGRLVGLGADPANVVAYFHEVISHIAAMAGVPEPPQNPGGSS